MQRVLTLLSTAALAAGAANVLVSAGGAPPLPLIVAHPLALLALLALLFSTLFPALIYRGGPAALAAAVRELRAAGPPLAGAFCAGGISWLNFDGPLLLVEVYPGGLLLTPPLMPPVALPAAAITALRPAAGFPLGLGLSTAIEIKHAAPHLISPVRLVCKQDSALARALRAIVAPGTPVEV